MGDMNSKHNRVVWADIPVADIDRSVAFYAAVLNVPVTKEKFDQFEFAILHHDQGNGGCLVPAKGPISSAEGILIYLNVDGRIRDAAAKAGKLGGKILEPIKSIGPHGFRVVILDSEGNRLALHSNTDA
ncbi:VOC family protein [soil metagenome]